MNFLLGVLLIALCISGILLVPFINVLYRIKFRTPQYDDVDSSGRDTSLFNTMHGWKQGTPNGAGILLVLIILVLFITFGRISGITFGVYSIALISGLVGFGLLGLYDDITKFFRWQQEGKRWRLSGKVKFLLQWIIAFFIGYILHTQAGYDSIRIPYWYILDGPGHIYLGLLYVVLAAVLIVTFANAFNITDGMDGLSGGLLLIVLVALWSVASVQHTEVLLIIAATTGVVIPFLYFNIYPARVLVGDTGALAFGATLAVIALLIRQEIAFIVMGGVFLVELLSSLLQILSYRLRNKKRIFRIAPLHHHLEAIGWGETKVTMRLWLAGAICALIGLLVGSLY